MKLSYSSACIIWYNKYLKCLFYSYLILFIILYHPHFANKKLLLNNSVKLFSVHLFVDFCLIYIFTVSRTILLSIEYSCEWYIYVYHIWDRIWDIFLIVGFDREIVLLFQIRTYSPEDLYLGEIISNNFVFG